MGSKAPRGENIWSGFRSWRSLAWSSSCAVSHFISMGQPLRSAALRCARLEFTRRPCLTDLYFSALAPPTTTFLFLTLSRWGVREWVSKFTFDWSQLFCAHVFAFIISLISPNEQDQGGGPALQEHPGQEVLIWVPAAESGPPQADHRPRSQETCPERSDLT